MITGKKVCFWANLQKYQTLVPAKIVTLRYYVYIHLVVHDPAWQHPNVHAQTQRV